MASMGKGFKTSLISSWFLVVLAQTANGKEKSAADQHNAGDRFQIGSATLTRQGDGPRKAPKFTLLTVYQTYLSAEHPVGDNQKLLKTGGILEVELAMKMGVDGEAIQEGFEKGFNANCSKAKLCGVFETQVKKLGEIIKKKVGRVKSGDRILFRFYADHVEIVLERKEPDAGQLKTESWTIADEKGQPSFARFLPLNWIGEPLEGSPKLPDQLLNVGRWGTLTEEEKKKAQGPFEDETPIATEPAQGHGA